MVQYSGYVQYNTVGGCGAGTLGKHVRACTPRRIVPSYAGRDHRVCCLSLGTVLYRVPEDLHFIFSLKSSCYCTIKRADCNKNDNDDLRCHTRFLVYANAARSGEYLDIRTRSARVIAGYMPAYL